MTRLMRRSGKSFGMSQRDRRALIVGVVSIGTLVMLSRGLPAWRTWRQAAYEEAIASSTDLARAEALLAISTPVHDSLSARNERFVALAPALLGGESPAAAGATLAGIISGAAVTASVRLGAIQIRPDTASSNAFTRISVRADATGDVRGVTSMIAALERGPTLLAVRSLSVDQPEPGSPSDQVEALRLTMVVEELMLTPRAVAAEAAAGASSRPDTSSTIPSP